MSNQVQRASDPKSTTPQRLSELLKVTFNASLAIRILNG